MSHLYSYDDLYCVDALDMKTLNARGIIEWMPIGAGVRYETVAFLVHHERARGGATRFYRFGQAAPPDPAPARLESREDETGAWRVLGVFMTREGAEVAEMDTHFMGDLRIVDGPWQDEGDDAPSSVQ